eukprot:NODE_66_length_23959_cov_0.323009.p15 type:complete len:125 gc:universal NODE_66_length_23959_cov_0.323009:10950-11324(+)
MVLPKYDIDFPIGDCCSWSTIFRVLCNDGDGILNLGKFDLVSAICFKLVLIFSLCCICLFRLSLNTLNVDLSDLLEPNLCTILNITLCFTVPFWNYIKNFFNYQARVSSAIVIISGIICSSCMI